jgi:DNA-binding MurR/RpiR family transcriptional regulator
MLVEVLENDYNKVYNLLQYKIMEKLQKGETMESKYIQITKDALPSLTKGLKKVGEYLLTDPMVFATHPAKKVGEVIGVSETMVIRFCHQIGYAGYTALQQEVRQTLLNINSKESETTPTDSSKRFLHRMADDITQLERNIEHIDEDAMEEAIELLITSERVIVAGYYQSFSFAHWLAYTLNIVKGNTFLYRAESDAGLLMYNSKQTAIVIFSFFRYAMDTIRLAEEAKKEGIPIILITDSWTSPATEYADIVIPLLIDKSNPFLNKGPVIMSFLHSMLGEIINRMENRGKVQETYKYFIKDGEK